MAIVKTSELIGPALDWAVAKCEGIDLRGDPLIHGKDVGTLVYRPRPDYHEYHWEHWKPSTDWSQGGPLNEREKISITVSESSDEWNAEYRFKRISDDEYWSGPTALIAAMRCYIASKLGDEVEIPEELC